jgi:hypothetical protein
LVGHYRTNIRKIQVDQCRNGDQIRNRLNTLTQYVIGCLESFLDWFTSDDIQQIVIAYDNIRINEFL